MVDKKIKLIFFKLILKKKNLDEKKYKAFLFYFFQSDTTWIFSYLSYYWIFMQFIQII